MAAGGEITVPQGSTGNLGTLGAGTLSLITCDGGSRSVDGHQVAEGQRSPGSARSADGPDAKLEP
eukprot:946663-Lingulodinium_polyedra.AAC.1